MDTIRYSFNIAIFDMMRCIVPSLILLLLMSIVNDDDDNGQCELVSVKGQLVVTHCAS